MKSKKRLLEGSRLYVIIDKGQLKNKPLPEIINRAGKFADVIQLRDKLSKKEAVLRQAFLIKKLLTGTDKLFIINDYLDVAKIVDADGVHLGGEDISVRCARNILGKDKIIGSSCHALNEAIDAQQQGADYISFGPVFKTPLKPKTVPVGMDLIKKLNQKISIPFFVIGGINQDNLDEVLSAGARRIVVCRLALSPWFKVHGRYLYNRLRITKK